MAIKIKSLKVGELEEKSMKNDYLYKDLSLDIENAVYYNKQLNKNVKINDIAVIYDVESVKNSIRTALLTTPGENILNPEYGADLRQFIFEPVDKFTTLIIKNLIEDELPRMEPRVQIENVNVVGDEDNNTYYIQMQINVPSLGITGLSIKSELNSTGYTIL